MGHKQEKVGSLMPSNDVHSEEEMGHKLAVLISAYNFTHVGDSLTDIEKIEKSDAMHAILSQIRHQNIASTDIASVQYFESVMRARSKSNPDMTIKEFYDGQFEQKHEYIGAESDRIQSLNGEQGE